MMRNIIAILLAALCLVGCVLAEAASGDWTAAILADEALAAAYPYYRLVDVNGDGTPLLFLTTTENAFITAEDRGALFACVDGEAKQLMTFGEAGGERFYMNAEERTLTYFSRLSGEAHIVVYRVENGALQLVTLADTFQPGHGPTGNNTESVYLQDGAAITAEEADALWALYASEDDEVTYGPRG